MLSLIVALSIAGAQPLADQDVSPPPAAQVTRVSKADQVVCKWRTNGAGHTMEVCQTNRQWRDDQIENQKRFDDFQRRALTQMPK